MWTYSSIVTSDKCSHFHSFDVHSFIDSSNMIGKFPEALNSNRVLRTRPVHLQATKHRPFFLDIEVICVCIIFSVRVYYLNLMANLSSVGVKWPTYTNRIKLLLTKVD